MKGLVFLGFLASLQVSTVLCDSAATTPKPDANTPTNWKNLTKEEWQKRLTPEVYNITRLAQTERAFKNKYYDNHKNGTYKCACCGTILFKSEDKFDSGTGWPSFSAPFAADRVTEKVDNTHGMKRVEVVCSTCDAHLGHVFTDGPKPTGKRYCMNSASLEFIEAGNSTAAAH